MGNEFSCPCNTSLDVEDNIIKQANNKDILKIIMNGKLTKEELLYEYEYESKFSKNKICLINSLNIEEFFNNRNLLLIETQHDISLYYTNIYISNYLYDESLVCIILQLKNNEINKNDYLAVYKIETLDFINENIDKKIDQLLNEFYLNLKNDYIFFGIIHNKIDKINIQTNEECNYCLPKNNEIKNKDNIKIIYKKHKKADKLAITYHIEIVNENLSKELILNIISKNIDKTLKNVINEYDNNLEKNIYLFIFEKNTETPEYDINEFQINKVIKNDSNMEDFLKEIAIKISNTNDTQLLTIINDIDGFFLVSKYIYSNNDNSI